MALNYYGTIWDKRRQIDVGTDGYTADLSATKLNEDEIVPTPNDIKILNTKSLEA